MKQVKCLLGGKGVLVDRHMGRLRESRALSSLNHLYGVFLLGFLWPVILLCLVLSPLFGLSQGPLMCTRASLSQDGFQRRGLWLGWHHSLFDLQGAFLRMCSQEGVLDLENAKWVVSYLGRVQLLLFFILEYLSRGDRLQLFSLGAICLLPQGHLTSHSSHSFRTRSGAKISDGKKYHFKVYHCEAHVCMFLYFCIFWEIRRLHSFRKY